MQHLDEGTIHAWLDDALARDEQMDIERHVQDCADCAALVAEARGMIAGASRIVSALDGVPGGVIPQTPQTSLTSPRRSAWRSLGLTPFRAGLAATLMIGVASTFAVRHTVTSRTAIDSVANAATVVVAPAAPQANKPATAAPAVQPPQPAQTERAKPTDLGQPEPPRERSNESAKSTAAAPPLASPPPPVATARDEAAAPTDTVRRKAMVAAAAPAVAADARGASVGSVSDSMSSTAGVAPRRGFAQNAQARMLQLSEVVVTGATDSRPTDLLGCYRIVRDSLPQFGLPDRFALDRVGSPPATRDVVRAVDIKGRMDSVLTQANWRAVNSAAAVVTWRSGSDQSVLHLARNASGVSGEAVVSGRSQPVRVIQATCLP